MGSRARATRGRRDAHVDRRRRADGYTASVMPTYEYACRSCGHTFEVIQSMSDDALTTCPVCQGELRKVFAPPAIAFKGSGFYATDHGKKSKPSESSSEEKGKNEKADGKSDSAKKDTGSTSNEGSTSSTSSAKKETTS
jgi:putative FmdB family regulatory protein